MPCIGRQPVKNDNRIMKKYIATASYIITILLLNTAFMVLPGVAAFGEHFSLADPFVGLVYIVRDFAQREIRHYVIFAMLVGTLLSYVLANKVIALASVSAFATGEIIDWAIYTFTRKPLSQRLLWSSIISTPIDSFVFLYVAHRLSWLPFTLMTIGKIIGIIILWAGWKIKNARTEMMVNV